MNLYTITCGGESDEEASDLSRSALLEVLGAIRRYPSGVRVIDSDGADVTQAAAWWLLDDCGEQDDWDVVPMFVQWHISAHEAR